MWSRSPKSFLRRPYGNGNGNGNVDYLQTVAQSLTNRPLFERVADTNQLWTDPRFALKEGKPPTHNQVVSMLARMVKVKLRRSTRLIDITVTAKDAELASKLANSVVSEYINSGAEREDSTIGLASKSLAKEADRLRKKLQESENALQAYKEETKASSLDDRENTVVAMRRNRPNDFRASGRIPGPIRLLAVGRLIRAKRFDRFLNVLARLRQHRRPRRWLGPPGRESVRMAPQISFSSRRLVIP